MNISIKMVLMSLTANTVFCACALPPETPPGFDASSPSSPPPPGAAAPHASALPPGALIFSDEPVWKAEVHSLAYIFYLHGAPYRKVTAAELNAMPLEELLKYNLLIIPGGGTKEIDAALTPETHSKLRVAIQQKGLNYLGFCAGAWLAVSPPKADGIDVDYGLGVVNGPIQEPTSLDKKGLKFAVVKASLSDGTQRELLWWGGPITPNIQGGVIAKYPDGTPAITQIWSGKGFVILSGLHPSATPATLKSLGIESTEAVDPELAWQLIDAATHQLPLASF